jgi:hypothetical protein
VDKSIKDSFIIDQTMTMDVTTHGQIHQGQLLFIKWTSQPVDKSMTSPPVDKSTLLLIKP